MGIRVAAAILSLLAVAISGCDVSEIAAETAVEAAIAAREFTIYIDGQQKVLTLPEVMSQYNPETKQILSGMLVQMAGAEPIEVEVTGKEAVHTYTAACRLVTGQSADGSPLKQNRLLLKVDTKTGSVEPADDVARSYFAIEGQRFGR